MSKQEPIKICVECFCKFRDDGSNEDLCANCIDIFLEQEACDEEFELEDD